MNPDHKSVIHRLRHGLGAQGFSQAVNLLIRLTEVPLFLAFWGAERYGEWLMVAAIPAYLAMADGGFAGTTQREMTMRMGAGDRQGALATFQSTWVLLLIVSVVVIAAAALATHLLPLSHWLNLKSMPGETLTAVILLLTAHIIIGFQCGLIYGGYSCEGRYARGTLLIAVSYLLDFGGLALAVMLGGGPIQAALGFLLGRLCGLLLFLFDLPKVAPWLHFGWGNASRAQVVRLFRPSLASTAFPLGAALNIQGMRLVVGLILGPVAVAVFSSIRTLCRGAMQPIVMVARLIEPEMALAYGAGHHDLLRKLFTRSSQITLWAALPTCVAFWFAGEPLLSLWTRDRIFLDAPLYALLLLASAANSLWFTALMVSYATNRHERMALLSLAANGGLVLLAIIVMPTFGLSGAGAAVLLAELVMAVWVLHAAFRLSGEKLHNWLILVAKPPVSMLYALRANGNDRS